MLGEALVEDVPGVQPELGTPLPPVTGPARMIEFPPTVEKVVPLAMLTALLMVSPPALVAKMPAFATVSAPVLNAEPLAPLAAPPIPSRPALTFVPPV